MKVAIVSPGFPPDVGGVEVVVAGLSKGLSALGHHVEVLTQSSRLAAPTVEEIEGVLVRRWPLRAPLPYLAMSPGLERFVWRHLRTYDIAHAHNFHSAAPVMAALAPRHPPLVLTLYLHKSGSTRLATALHVPYSALLRRVLGARSVVTAASSAEAALIKARFPEVAPVLIPNGVEVARFATAPDVMRPARQPGLVLSVGRLVEYKRVGLLIEALARVPAAALLVVGSGPEQARLSARVAELGLQSRVDFVGRVSSEELSRLYLQAELLVSLSRLESFGLAPLEAMAAGVNVVVSDIPAHRDLTIYDERGAVHLFDETEGPSALARLMQSLLGHGGLEPSSLVPTWTSVARQYERLYLEAAQG